MTRSPSAHLARMGLLLPALAQEHAREPNRGMAVEHDGTLFVSGTGTTRARGRLGASLDVEEGYRAARLVALVMLSRIEAAVGSIDHVERWLSVRGFVCCTDDFEDHSAVLDGFSDLMVSLFGDAAVCARSAIGAPALPLGIAVEVEATLRLRGVAAGRGPGGAAA